MTNVRRDKYQNESKQRYWQYRNGMKYINLVSFNQMSDVLNRDNSCMGPVVCILINNAFRTAVLLCLIQTCPTLQMIKSYQFFVASSMKLNVLRTAFYPYVPCCLESLFKKVHFSNKTTTSTHPHMTIPMKVSFLYTMSDFSFTQQHSYTLVLHIQWSMLRFISFSSSQVLSIHGPSLTLLQLYSAYTGFIHRLSARPFVTNRGNN